LNLASNQLNSIPDEIGECESLRVLILGSECSGGNNLIALPSSLGRLNNLRELDVSCNQLRHLPSSLSGCSELTSLSLTSNRLVSVQPIAQLRKLRTLNLAQNRLRTLPYDMIEMSELSVVDLSQNCLASLPMVLMEFLELRSVLLAGNPLNGKLQPLSSDEELDDYPYADTGIPSLVELAARMLIQNETPICRNHLTPRLRNYLTSMKGRACFGCDVPLLSQYHSKTIVEDCAGYPNVPQCVNTCTRCRSVAQPTKRAGKLSKLQTYLQWQRKHSDETMDW
jgi:hypothetical protein